MVTEKVYSFNKNIFRYLEAFRLWTLWLGANQYWFKQMKQLRAIQILLSGKDYISSTQNLFISIELYRSTHILFT